MLFLFSFFQSQSFARDKTQKEEEKKGKKGRLWTDRTGTRRRRRSKCSNVVCSSSNNSSRTWRRSWRLFLRQVEKTTTRRRDVMASKSEIASRGREKKSNFVAAAAAPVFSLSHSFQFELPWGAIPLSLEATSHHSRRLQIRVFIFFFFFFVVAWRRWNRCVPPGCASACLFMWLFVGLYVLEAVCQSIDLRFGVPWWQ